MNQETRVGLFVIGGILVIAIASFYLGDVRFERRYRFSIMFKNADGLPEKGPVKCAGVQVGRVERIDLAPDGAQVIVQVDKKYELHKDAVASVASTGVIGSKFLSITRGTSATPLIEDGDIIYGKQTLSFDAFADKLGELFEKDDKYGDPVENVKATLANLRSASQNLRNTLDKNSKAFDSLMANASQLSRDLKEIIGNNRENIDTAIANFRQITDRTNKILAQIQEGKGAIGSLVSDPQTGKNVKEAVASLKQTAKDAESLLGRVRRVRVYWDYRERYDIPGDRFKSDLGVKIVPRPGKFYQIAVNNIGSSQNLNQPGVDLERHNTITAVFGRDFGPLSLSVGAIRSKGGVGAAFRPFWTNPKWGERIELAAEAYDFDRDETLQGIKFDKPNYNAGIRFGILRWLYAGLSLEDIAVTDHVFGSLNVQLRDDDIAYLLGLASLGHP